MNETCQDRVKSHLQGRMNDLRKLWAAECVEVDSYVEDIGTLNEYGLCFEYVDEDDAEPFFRYQLSTGGPGDEFRFFVGLNYRPYRIEYWFLDWFDGAHIVLAEDDIDFMRELWTCVFAYGAEALVQHKNSSLG